MSRIERGIQLPLEYDLDNLYRISEGTIIYPEIGIRGVVQRDFFAERLLNKIKGLIC